MRHGLAVLILLFPGAVFPAPAAAQDRTPRTITRSLTLPKDVVLTTPLVIRASHIVVDGNGATLQGPGEPGKKATFQGTGITADGCSKVTIKNLTVRGFERGLAASNGEGWHIENCDFSDNYHDPDFGWGDYRRVGGMILTAMNGCTIRACRANRVWNGLDLWRCNRNTIEKNDFSHCSNVCLKLWTSSQNQVLENNLSYGIRIRPGEVHARDSTCVLIESGSDGNYFFKNDITHGGDGLFIRVLNGWVSTGNVFVQNDCSHANNNGFESWSPGNQYRENKANHCSYGFWLGGSDRTVLWRNEAAYNGQPDGPHNAPEPDFGHGGIVIVNGPGSHTLIDGNHCHHNNGGGIVFRGDLGSRGERWKMFHLVVQRNRLTHNKWGLFARFTDRLDLAANVYEQNERDELLEEVTHLVRHGADPLPDGAEAPRVVLLRPPEVVAVGKSVTLDASGSSSAVGQPLQFCWDVGGTEYREPRVSHVFTRPGFHRVGVTVSDGVLANLGYCDVYAVERVNEIATEGQAKRWGWRMGQNADHKGQVTFADDREVRIVGGSSVRMRPDPYRGADVAAIFPARSAARWDLSRRTRLQFWLKFRNPNNGGFQGVNPIVRLHAGDAALTYTPVRDGIPRNLLGDLPYSEARWGWLLVTIPLAGSDAWNRAESIEGAQPPHVDHDLVFETVSTPVATQGASALASDGRYLYLAAHDHGTLSLSRDGTQWKALPRPEDQLPGAGKGWINGMLVWYPKVPEHPEAGERGSLYLALGHPDRDPQGRATKRLAAFDLARKSWSWLPTRVTLGHGATVVGDHLFGLAHAVGGNYGGPLCRVNLKKPGEMDERSTLGPLAGDSAWWMSRAAQLATVDNRVFGIKNDWKTPQPEDRAVVGDRLFSFDPDGYAPSVFSGEDRWKESSWKAACTPVQDLGPLPFEVGHGAALLCLPPRWCKAVGARGGLFIVAGCSPSNHEGRGAASDRYAIYDLESKRYLLGRLPGPTGAGTSAAFHDGKVFVKRGGMSYDATNRELWVVRPVPPDQAQALARRAAKARLDLSNVDRLSLQFDSMGWEPFDVWIDGLNFR